MTVGGTSRGQWLDGGKQQAPCFPREHPLLLHLMTADSSLLAFLPELKTSTSPGIIPASTVTAEASNFWE